MDRLTIKIKNHKSVKCLAIYPILLSWVSGCGFSQLNGVPKLKETTAKVVANEMTRDKRPEEYISLQIFDESLKKGKDQKSSSEITWKSLVEGVPDPTKLAESGKSDEAVPGTKFPVGENLLWQKDSLEYITKKANALKIKMSEKEIILSLQPLFLEHVVSLLLNHEIEENKRIQRNIDTIDIDDILFKLKNLRHTLYDDGYITDEEKDKAEERLDLLSLKSDNFIEKHIIKNYLDKIPQSICYWLSDNLVYTNTDPNQNIPDERLNKLVFEPFFKTEKGTQLMYNMFNNNFNGNNVLACEWPPAFFCAIRKHIGQEAADSIKKFADENRAKYFRDTKKTPLPEWAR